MPATEDAQERGLAAAIRAKEEAARTLGQVYGEVIQNQGLAARFEGVLVTAREKEAARRVSRAGMGKNSNICWGRSLKGFAPTTHSAGVRKAQILNFYRAAVLGQGRQVVFSRK